MIQYLNIIIKFNSLFINYCVKIKRYAYYVQFDMKKQQIIILILY